MKTYEITMKSGKKYVAASNGKVYAGKVYLIRPIGGHITITDATGTFESPRKEIIIEKSDIQAAKTI